MSSSPTLSDLAAHPERAADLPPHAAAMLLAQVASVQTVLLGRLLAGLPAQQRMEDLDDRLLTVEEAAAMLTMTKDYLYRHADELPFSVRPAPKQLRFSKLGIQRYIRQRQGR